MLLLLACLFLVAAAIGCYVAAAVAAAVFGTDAEPTAAGAPHPRL